jgi:UDP-glucose 4-epimerase
VQVILLLILSKAGYDFVVYDNLSNSSKESIKRVEKIINKTISFEEGDIRIFKKCVCKI